MDYWITVFCSIHRAAVSTSVLLQCAGNQFLKKKKKIMLLVLLVVYLLSFQNTSH